MSKCKLTSELQQEFCEHMAAGLYQEEAAALVSVTRVTIFRWMKQGQQALEAAEDQLATMPADEQPDDVLELVDDVKQKYASFYRAVTAAENEAIRRNVKIIQEHGAGERTDGDWRAAAWFVERRKPDSWGQRGKHKVEHTGADGGPVEVKTEGKQRLVLDDETSLAVVAFHTAEELTDDDGEPPVD